MQYLKYYDLEAYLFETVRPRFAAQGYLSAFDFFCIVIWKANRAKSMTAKRIKRDGESLDETIKALTAGLAHQATPKERMRYLVDANAWRFTLPMASAILTVLYPEEFTVYDVRVCDSLQALKVSEDFHGLANRTNFENLWTGYQRFKAAVESTAPSDLSLRDKDRWLWARSFVRQLERDTKTGFQHPENGTAERIE